MENRGGHSLRVSMDCGRVETETETLEVNFRYNLSSLDTYIYILYNLKVLRIVTWVVVIWFACLFGYIELIEIYLLVIEYEGARVLSEVLIEPIYRPNHEVSTV